MDMLSPNRQFGIGVTRVSRKIALLPVLMQTASPARVAFVAAFSKLRFGGFAAIFIYLLFLSVMCSRPE